MALSAKLTMRQAQSLTMTPQLLQSIRLLQYGSQELQSYVDQEVERNPLLRREPASASTAASTTVGVGPRSGTAGTRDFGEAFDSGLENLPEQALSLQAHARSEVRDTLAGRTERAIGEALVERLDESGYLSGADPVAETAAALGIDVAAVEGVLARLLREVAPAGLFARSLAECLGAQLSRRDRFDPVMRTVIDNLDLLASRDFGALRRLTGESEAGLLEILGEIRALDPKPGHAFAHAPVEALTPDVLVRECADGGWEIELNPDALPRVLVDQTYTALVRAGALTSEERTFVGECQQSANWLVRALDQRATTIAKVAAEIVRRQDGFFARGVEGLRPMTLMAVAEAVGMHESTISRVTASKHIATPRGTFEMRYFFTVAIAASDGGDAHSAESVKHRIRTLIGAESPGNVLSDDDIKAKLKSEGIDLARRTVAKYREAQGLPSSIRRRRELNARALAS